MAEKVIVVGGGVAGMTVAHELAERGFEVVVYEQRDVPGGKARSIDAVGQTTGVKGLPGEHGFRFFPGFYRHVTDTMSRIPFGRRGTVFDNLTQSTRIEVAQHGRPALISPAQFPRSPQEVELALRSGWDFATQLGIPVGDQLHFFELLTRLQCACDARRFGEYENESWWQFCGAQQRSPGYRRYLADGLTRTLVAARAREMSARTGGYILLQLVQDMVRPGAQVDRVLNAPTNDAWIDPWLSRLRTLGVDYRLCHRVDTIHSRGERVIGVSGHEVSWPGQQLAASFADRADYYVAAVPVEVMQSQLKLALKRRAIELRNLDRLVYRWMNGIMFYLTEDLPLVHGHTIMIDSPWALTAISQRQFWPEVDFSKFGGGKVKGLLSVDISEWKSKGRYAAKGKPADVCSKQVIAEEVWAQLKTSLNGASEVLCDDMLFDWFLDPDIVAPNPAGVDTNLEPLLVNTKGSWRYRPEAALPEVPNLFLASDYVRTYTDLATMEGANEAGRRAVNAILETAGSKEERCELWKLREAGGPFAVARLADRVLYTVT
jgi:uncharacterized protein with NAD-binding domain and iron-sulfur cluster